MMQKYINLLMLFIAFICFSKNSFAKKTNQAIYVEPFDLAAGGANLTRASQIGVMYANPALMAFPKKFHRWFGGQFSLISNRESIDMLRNATSGDGLGDSDEIVDTAFDTPIHLGMMSTFSWVTRNFGVSILGRFEPDIEGKEYGVSGLPAINFSAEAYGAVAFSFATQVTRWMSIGVTPKYLAVAEPDIEIGLTDEAAIERIAEDPESFASYGRGTAIDVGCLIFLQGKHLDFRLALKVDDLGDTKFSGTSDPFLQTIHAGMSLTLHGTTEALHLSVDYRDIQGVYEEKTFKRLYMGAKFLVQNHIGLAAGLYQGIPSVGVRLDLFIVNIGLTAYGREMGNYIGEKQRNLYVAYIGFGG